MRVLPRDAFNDANLLKCIGALWIALEGKPGVEWEYEGEAFDIQQDESDGSTFVANVTLYIYDEPVNLTRPLNSRDPYPLYAIGHDEELRVFTDTGQLTEGFKKWL